MYKAKLNNRVFEVDLQGDGLSHGKINNIKFNLDSIEIGKDSLHVLHENQSFVVRLVKVNKEEKTIHLRVNGNNFEVKVASELDQIMEKFGMLKSEKIINSVKSQMPGKILKIFVKPGDSINEGDSILILEAMKMENIIKSPIKGIIETIEVKESQSINKSDILVKFKK